MESAQPLNLFSRLLQMPFADPCYFPTRTSAAFAHSQNCCDLFQRKAEHFGLANKTQAVQVFCTIDSVPRLPSWRVGKKSLAFVETNRLNVDSGLLRQFADLHTRSLNPIPMYRVNCRRSKVVTGAMTEMRLSVGSLLLDRSRRTF